MAEIEVIEKTEGKAVIICAYCNGKGLDPFKAMSILSDCQVCKGRGRITVSKPFVKCPFCNGSGIHPSRRYTCIVCHAKGVVAAPPEDQRVTCLACGGTGRSRTLRTLPCLLCKGKGFVLVPPKEERQECPRCQGTGRIRPDWNIPCPKCRGKGFIAKSK